VPADLVKLPGRETGCIAIHQDETDTARPGPGVRFRRDEDEITEDAVCDEGF